MSMNLSSLNEVLQVKKFLAVMLFAFMIAAQARAAEFEMVEYSAQVKLQWLTEAGVPEAQKFLKTLERPVFFHADNLEDFERIKMTNALYQEMNMTAAIEFIRAKNYNNVIDLACSLSPRAMILGDEGRRVIVGELATVCLIGDWFIDEFGTKAKRNVDYEVIPIEDGKIMMTCADKFKGEICIVEQGLMIYLNDEQLGKMYDNICAVLKKHGGCMITSDFTQKKYFMDAATALYGKENAPTLYAETKAMYEKVLDDKLNDDALQDEQAAVEFLKAHGLSAKKIPLFTEPPELYIKSKLTPAQRRNVDILAAKNYLWVITAL